jgi:hypothetical protein
MYKAKFNAMMDVDAGLPNNIAILQSEEDDAYIHHISNTVNWLIITEDMIKINTGETVIRKELHDDGFLAVWTEESGDSFWMARVSTLDGDKPSSYFALKRSEKCLADAVRAFEIWKNRWNKRICTWFDYIQNETGTKPLIVQYVELEEKGEEASFGHSQTVMLYAKRDYILRILSRKPRKINMYDYIFKSYPHLNDEIMKAVEENDPIALYMLFPVEELHVMGW